MHDQKIALADARLDWDSLVQDTRVHRRIYTDPHIFDLEMARVFSENWVFLSHESQIPEAGDFVQVRMAGRAIIVVRGKKGEIHALLNRCPHRGALVCREKQGNQSLFTCPYHGWKFKLNGNLFTVPGMDAYGENFNRAAMSMGRLPRLENYRGFIFGSFNAEVDELTTYLGPARNYLDQWLDQGGDIAVCSQLQRYEMRCNWKMIYDNAGDGYHVPFSHQSLIQMTGLRYGGGDMEYFGSADSTEMRAYALGNGHTLIDQRPEMYRKSGWEQQRPQPGREAFEQAVRERLPEDQQAVELEKAVGAGMNLNIFPNLLLIGNQIQVIEPVSVNRSILHWHATSLKDADEELNTMRFRTQEDFPIMGEVDDAANFEACQEGLESFPEMEWVDISRHVATGKDERQEDGTILTAPTSELHARHYLGYWKNLMQASDGQAQR